jgi:hypothetical protein
VSRRERCAGPNPLSPFGQTDREPRRRRELPQIGALRGAKPNATRAPSAEPKTSRRAVPRRILVAKEYVPFAYRWSVHRSNKSLPKQHADSFHRCSFTSSRRRRPAKAVDFAQTPDEQRTLLYEFQVPEKLDARKVPRFQNTQRRCRNRTSWKLPRKTSLGTCVESRCGARWFRWRS